MKRIYIFRHGMTQAVKENRGSYGKHILDAEILPESVEVIEKMAEFLKQVPESLNYCSEILRCRQTAEIVTKVTRKEFIFDPRLNEYRSKGWENPFSFYRRIKSIFAEISSSTVEDILICTHSAGISALLKIISKSRRPWFMMKTIQPGVLVIDIDGKLEQVNFANGPDPKIVSVSPTDVPDQRKNLAEE